MENRDKSAFPVSQDVHVNYNERGSSIGAETGMTKLEHFTSLAMQGILSAATRTGFLEPKEVAERSVRTALKTLEELERITQQSNQK